MTDTSNDHMEPILPEDVQGEIERRAYFKYCERGCGAGRDVDDWLAAEREIVAERALVASDAQSDPRDGRAETVTTPSQEAPSVERRKSPASGGGIPHPLSAANTQRS